MPGAPVQKKNISKKGKKGGELVVTGLAASPGLVIGRAFAIKYGLPKVPVRILRPEAVRGEIERFHAALARTRTQCEELRDSLKIKLKDKTHRIFDAHLMMIDDSLLIDQTLSLIREQFMGAEQAFSVTVDKIAKVVGSHGNDQYLRERVDDIWDVQRRVLSNLMGFDPDYRINLKEPAILIAHDLTPSQTAQLDRTLILGAATDVGGSTSHTAILSRSLEIPAVVGLENITELVVTGDEIIVDGYNGTVTIRPEQDKVKVFYDRARGYRQIEDQLAELQALPAKTIDGMLVELSANIEFPEEVDSVISHGARGVGLFRTEFLYLTRNDLPSEEEQYEAYAKVVSCLKPEPVIIRTLDAGADKFAVQLQSAPDANPFLGNRAIRICLKRKDIFRTQLRALLRATVHGNLKILLPFISTIEELKKSIAFIRKVRRELEREGALIAPRTEIGSMIEVPSAALMIEDFLPYVDFISIGTNDLIQYLLAVDRGNEKVAHLYQPFNPAVIRLIDSVIKAARKANKWVGVCGEMAGSPYSALLLVGMGVVELSASPASVPGVKKIIRSVSYKEARALAEKVLTFNSTARIKNFLTQQVEEIDREIIELYKE